MSCDSDALQKGDVVRSVCPCCHQDKDCDDSPLKSDDPDNNCSCPNCICEGATLPDGPKVAAVDFQLALAHWFIQQDADANCRIDCRSTAPANPPPRLVCGHIARAAFQVWLI